MRLKSGPPEPPEVVVHRNNLCPLRYLRVSLGSRWANEGVALQLRNNLVTPRAFSVTFLVTSLPARAKIPQFP